MCTPVRSLHVDAIEQERTALGWTGAVSLSLCIFGALVLIVAL
jgi:hypothetical protein